MKIRCTLSIFSLVFLFFTQIILSRSLEKPPIKIPMENSALTLNEDFIKVFNFGHGRLVAAITWVVTLIEGDIEHYQSKDGNSWMFHRFNTISIYDPLFYENYLYGGQYLSVIKDDLVGAEYIFDKGLRFYPKDFWLNYNAGFNSYFEMGKREKAVGYFETMMELPKAIDKFPILPSLLTKMRVGLGNSELAYTELFKLYETLPESYSQKKALYQTLYSIKAKKDLKCLNSNYKKGCDLKDLDGNYYEKKEGLYYANRDLRSLTIKLRKRD